MALTAELDRRVAAGNLKPDTHQRQVAGRFDDLLERLHSQPSRLGFIKRLIGKSPVTIKGLYVFGEVGRGKTMLMDLFFEAATGIPKHRTHFHAFMQDVHARRTSLKSDDVIGEIADKIARQAQLLCLDEMQIVDIADAMIIGRLFDALQARGVCFVTTSNLPPDGLYKDGLNRQLFLPFIEKLKSAMDVVSLDSRLDYRLGRIKSRDTYIVPLGAEATAKLNGIWNELTDNATGRPVDIELLGRKLRVPKASHGCAYFTFADLCENPLGPADYLAIAGRFKTVFIDGIPVLGQAKRNQAKRFVLMIDTFYDAGTRLVATAEAEPEHLYPKGQHGFEFQRTVSRLKEMQSAYWWGKPVVET